MPCESVYHGCEGRGKHLRPLTDKQRIAAETYRQTGDRKRSIRAAYPNAKAGTEFQFFNTMVNRSEAFRSAIGIEQADAKYKRDVLLDALWARATNPHEKSASGQAKCAELFMKAMGWIDIAGRGRKDTSRSAQEGPTLTEDLRKRLQVLDKDESRPYAQEVPTLQ